jgi:competence/damage-inducible protein CinA C-terminal domain
MPSAEILAIGTELLLGHVLDTNSQYLSDELARIGIDCYYHTTVGDNKNRVKKALAQALSRSEIVLTSGGLGPTPDDLTMECIAEVMGVPMIMDDEVLAYIREFFTQRGITMPEVNSKQALRPEGADILPNPGGTAPGIIWKLTPDQLKKAGILTNENNGEAESSFNERNRYILTFPGVPSELRRMWRETGSKFLQSTVVGASIFSVELKHYGIGESALAEKYRDLLDGSNPTVAPYAGQGECRLRVTAKADSVEDAWKLVAPVADLIKHKSGELCYGVDDDTLESVVGKLLTENKWKIAVAESCTGGLVSKRLTDIAGSSNFVSLNLVTYSNEAKCDMLGVSQGLLEVHGAVSAECAEAMAEGVRRVARADIGIGITGIAGPGGGTPEKPIGLVYIGLAAKGYYCGRMLKLGDRLSRTEIRHRTANEALNMVRLFMIDRPASLPAPKAK